MPLAGPVFTLDHVTVERGGHVLLHDVCAEIPEAACTALIGPSGAGKSTLLRLLNRLVEPDSGAVRYDHQPLPDLDVLELRRRVQLVGQQPVLLTEHVRDELRAGCPGLDDDEAAALLNRVGLPLTMLGRRTAGLSGGEAQRLCLARALALRPRVLLLDEPTSALDAASAQAVERTVHELIAAGLTTVVVSHDAVQTRRIADHVLVLRAGRLVDRGPAERITYLKEGA